jgi:Family of unknown function (DUF5681)
VMDDGKVGYKRPPKATQFKPGKTGNARGRPKGSRKLDADLVEMLSQVMTVREGGKTRRISRQEAILRRLLSQALQGDEKAIKLILSMRTKVDATRQAADQQPEEDTSDADQVLFDDYVRRQLEDMRAKENEQRSPQRDDDGLS